MGDSHSSSNGLLEGDKDLTSIGSVHGPQDQQANATEDDDRRKNNGSGAIGPVKFHNAAIEICHVCLQS